MNKKILLALAASAAIALLGAGCQPVAPANNGATPTQPVTTNQGAAKGQVVVSITDAAAAMDGVTAVNLTVNKIEMHSALQGWVTVSNDVKQYDLLALKAKGALSVAAQASIPVGTYDQIRLSVQTVQVIKAGVAAEAKLPSNKLEIFGTFNVAADATTSLKLDFLASESLHLTGSGKFIFAPVIQTESRTNADVSVKEDGTVELGGGKVENDAKSGMDLQGSMRDNFKFEASDTLEINNNTIELKSTSSVKANPGVDLKVKDVLNQ